MPRTKLPIGAERSYYGGVRTVLPALIVPVVIVANTIVIFWSDLEVLSAPGLLLNVAFPLITVLVFLPAGGKGSKGKLDADTSARQARLLTWYAFATVAASVVVAIAFRDLSASIYLAFTAAITGGSAFHFHKIGQAIEAIAQQETNENAEQES